MDEPDDRRFLALQIAWQLYGLPYKYGGDDPMEGLDCSGFAVELLQSVGILPHGSDYTAQQLRQAFASRAISLEQAARTHGALIFYGTQLARIEHVAVSLGVPPGFAIQAAGGGQLTTDPAKASASNAFVKVRPFLYRGTPIAACDPFAP